MDPPQCVQNAMMTKDKKPFTYTPSGINLSEIKSPRLSRRIERNANFDGVSQVPNQPPPPQNHGPLPPSALAAMQPQMHVQVFPSGPPPPPPMGGRGGAPPPPPPPANGPPPPPPPPSQPLPTQKVMTGDNQVLERPDMTKIIPDNPMALLRKTGGPKPRNFVDEMYQNGAPQVSQPQMQYAPPPQPQVQKAAPPPPPRSPENVREPPRYQPPVIERAPQQSPPVHQQQPQYQQQQPRSPPVQQQAPRTPEVVKHVPSYQAPVIERAPVSPRPAPQEPPAKSVNVGSLYIPPVNQQSQPQQRVVSPPTPPQRSTDSPVTISPGTPPLKQAPRPWQQKSQQQESVPEWARRDVASEPQAQYQSQQSPPIQQQQNPTKQSIPVHIEVKSTQRPTSPYQQQRPQPNRQQYEQPQQPSPNAVYVTQPVVLQHPGPGPRGPTGSQQQHQPPTVTKPRVDNQGAFIIPIQIEGKNTTQPIRTPGTPVDRSLQRQQSWGNNPTQSNTFRVIQKITNTDDEEDDNVPVTSHSPKYPSNFQQVPAEQLRRMKMSEGDRNLVDRFRQVSPGPQQPVNRGPQVRTIPVQIEGNGQQQYVHPSQQTVPEPKKYTGSSIPSRSFKILQAMTSPDGCANVNQDYETIEQSDVPLNEQWGVDPNYPPYSPYWHEYYYPPYPQELSKSESSEKKSNSSQRTTPVPFWGYYPPPYCYGRPLKTPSTDVESDSETIKSSRRTPIPFWNYYAPPPPPPPYQRPLRTPLTEDESDAEKTPWGYPCYPTSSEESFESKQSNYPPPYPPYFDPYYYPPYCYGYPPVYSPYPMYHVPEGDDYAGYSSTDEMAYYNNRFTQQQQLKQKLNQKLRTEECSTPKIVITPTNTEESKEEINFKHQEATFEAENSQIETPVNYSDEETLDSDTEAEEEENLHQKSKMNGLKSIPSVSNVHMYNFDESIQQYSDEEPNVEEVSEATTDTIDDDDASIYIIEDDALPHQLSVIFEETERTDSRVLRESSVVSDSTTIADDVDEEYNTISMRLPLQLETSNSSEMTTMTVGEAEVKKLSYKIEQEETEIYTSFTLKSPSLTPRKRSLCRFDSEEPSLEENVYINNDIEPEKTVEHTKEKVEEKETEKKDESEQDWWSIISNDDDTPSRKPKVYNSEETDNIDNHDIKSAQNSNKEDEITIEKQKEIEKKKVDDGKIVMRDFAAKLKEIKDIHTKSGTIRRQSLAEEQALESKFEEQKQHDFWAQINDDDDSETEEATQTLTEPENITKTEEDKELIEDQEKQEEEKEEEEEEEIDFWSTIGNTDELTSRRPVYRYRRDTDSTRSRNSSVGESQVSKDVESKETENSIVQETLEADVIEIEQEVTEIVEILNENKIDACVALEQQVVHELKEVEKVNIVYEDESNDYYDDEKHVNKDVINYDESKDVDYYTEVADGNLATDENAQEEAVQNKYLEEEEEEDSNNYDEVPVEVPSIKDRIRALHESVKQKEKSTCSSQEQGISRKHTPSLTNDKQQQQQQEYLQENEDDESSDSESEESDSDSEKGISNININGQQEPLSIKERIKALQESVKQKQQGIQEQQELKVQVKQKISALEIANSQNSSIDINNSVSKTTSTKSSMKSFEEFSEEEIDSGITSDMSRHISDNEEFTELKKMSRYQRAATHSRLFRLLQDECDEDDEEKEPTGSQKSDDKFAKLSVRRRMEEKKNEEKLISRDQLSLPLKNMSEPDSMSSSGLTSPNSPVNEKLVNEVVQSLLRKKKGQIFRNMPKEKLYAAALRILQEDMDGLETPSEECVSFLSPLRTDTENSTPAQTPQEFYGNYNEYCQYYDTWSEADRLYYENYDICPSKAFKLIKDHLNTNKTGTISGFLAKCPKILSSKNVHKDLYKLLEGSEDADSAPTTPEKTKEVKEVAS
ncbi:protein piccolo isoform X2 [Aethina tumida]|uniref:protein piccolo isoform X2 n=1 Tax=Aethina tumida TaxID=116153 RepID=UPI002147A3A9|nr:protein piccolo isoform X2 [Aethina tumida]